VNAKFGNVPVLRLSNGYINPQGKPDPLTVMYFVEGKTGYIRGRGRYSIITVFNDLEPFGEKSVARKLTMLGGDVTRMDITADTLEPATDANESIFRVAGAKPVFTSADEDGRFTQPGAVYAAKPSLPGWHGKVTCDLNIDEHGHVRGVEVKDTMDDAITKPIREALMNWEYAPATINGHPSLGYVHVNVE
jgi:Gram-negative bacterial TonB protein C-terminal